jgi:hypothetical protein
LKAKAAQIEPKPGQLWVRKSDKAIIEVDRLKDNNVHFTVRYNLTCYEYPKGKFLRCFRWLSNEATDPAWWSDY